MWWQVNRGETKMRPVYVHLLFLPNTLIADAAAPLCRLLMLPKHLRT
jgi:hypothetical protein